MGWNMILENKKRRVALLQSDSDVQYVVATAYDPTAPEGQKWGHGSYFMYVTDKEKAKALSGALDLFRYKTEQNYIQRERMSEIATKAIDVIRGDEDDLEFFNDLEPSERNYFDLEVDDYE